jgi:asparagine synthetase B (glutamine-hydrolysing)
MQLQFGVFGEGPAADAVFARLASSAATGPTGPAPRLAESPGCRLGSIDRSTAWWQVPGSDRWFHVDGEVRVVDGVETTGRGLDEAGRAAIARLYDRAGTDAWSRLDGSFCLVVRDGATVHVVMDVVGARAVYWWLADGILAFHSHLLDLAPAYPGRLSEDLGAIGSFLEGGRYLPTTTAWREVRHLGAGQALTFAGGVATVRDHFAMPFDPDPPRIPDARVVDEVIGLLEASVGRGWREADAPVVPLSGGMDSRYIAAELVRRNGPRSVPTITWGEAPDRPGSDAIVAARVAAALDLRHDWFDKPQRHTPETFDRALYLASGEGDCAIHYPDDHGLHAQLASLGFRSLFRGDECFGNGPNLLTNGAVPVVNGLAAIGRDGAYRTLLGDDLFGRIAAEQEPALHDALAGLRSATPTARRGELWYSVGVRRFLGPYNRVKQADLEVYAPLLDRALLERLRSTPDRLRADKALLQAALDRRFPGLGAIPYATDDNLPRWEARVAADPAFARVLLDRLAAPGWLDAIGARARVVAALRDLEDAAVRAGGDAASGAPGDGTRAPAGAPPDGASSRLRAVVKQTWPGRLARELTLERRFAANLPPYLRLARLTVLHELLASRSAG